MEKCKEIDCSLDISFFVPCLNEEIHIIPSLEKISAIVKSLGLTYELLVYNDASTDDTKNLIEKYKKANSEELITIVNNRVRRGLGFNYIEGAFAGNGKYYMMICGDNAETEQSIISILEKMGAADMIIPYFGDRDTRNFIRRGISCLFASLVNLANGYKIRYYNGPVLHLRRNVMRWHPVTTGFGYQAELISLLIDEGNTYFEILVSNKDREGGISRAFNLLNVLSVVHSITQIFLRRIRRSIWPI